MHGSTIYIFFVLELTSDPSTAGGGDPMKMQMLITSMTATCDSTRKQQDIMMNSREKLNKTWKEGLQCNCHAPTHIQSMPFVLQFLHFPHDS